MGKCCDMRGFLTFTALRLIGKRPMSGEELRQELESRKGSRPSPGTIYPVLKAMKKSGWIEEAKQGSKKSSKEKKYKLTARGRKELAASTKKFVAIFCDMKDDFRKAGK